MKNTIIIAATLLIIAAIGVSSYMLGNGRSLNVAYVDNDVLFQGYKEKKELEQEFISMKNTQKAYLDSLGLEILAIRKENANSPLLKEKENHYENLLYEVEKSNQIKEQEYMQKLWIKINQYVRDYGKERGYDFIHGATGNGSIMYADTSRNITADVINYVNMKYEGNK